MSATISGADLEKDATKIQDDNKAELAKHEATLKAKDLAIKAFKALPATPV